jgi:hypothetical protein
VPWAPVFWPVPKESELLTFIEVRYMTKTPVMIVIPELDTISPPEDQRALFDTFSEPKELHVAIGKRHLDVLSGDDFPTLSIKQAAFVKHHTE